MALHFELVTPARLVRSEDVYMVVVPGTEGEEGVLEGHAPYMTTVKDGPLKIYRTENGTPEEIMVQGGFAEVSAAGLTVLAEHVDETGTAATATQRSNQPDRV
jgi:F-type H+-transporting ATPase subunit epsilon